MASLIDKTKEFVAESFPDRRVNQELQPELYHIPHVGTTPNLGWIKAVGEVTKLEVPLKVPNDFLKSLLKAIGRDWDIDYELKVGLTVDLPIIGNLTLPLSTKGEMKLHALSDIF